MLYAYMDIVDLINLILNKNMIPEKNCIRGYHKNHKRLKTRLILAEQKTYKHKHIQRRALVDG